MLFPRGCHATDSTTLNALRLVRSTVTEQCHLFLKVVYLLQSYRHSSPTLPARGTTNVGVAPSTKRAKRVPGRCESSDVIAARESVYNCLIARTRTKTADADASVPVPWLPWLLIMYSQLRSKRTTRTTGRSTCGWGAARIWSRPRSEFAFLATFSGRKFFSRGVWLNPSENTYV